MAQKIFPSPKTPENPVPDERRGYVPPPPPPKKDPPKTPPATPKKSR